MSKLSEIEARVKATLEMDTLPYQDRRYLLGLVKEMQSCLMERRRRTKAGHRTVRFNTEEIDHLLARLEE